MDVYILIMTTLYQSCISCESIPKGKSLYACMIIECTHVKKTATQLESSFTLFEVHLHAIVCLYKEYSHYDNIAFATQQDVLCVVLNTAPL